MKKLFLVLFVLVFCVSLQAQTTTARRLEFEYGNGFTNWTSSVGDSLTGVATDSDNVVVDFTLSGAGSKFEYYPDMIMLVLDGTDIRDGEGVTVQFNQGIGSVFEYNATLDTLLTAPGAPPAIRFYDLATYTNTPATQGLFTFKAYASAANTDSLSYVVKVTGIYKK